VNEEEEEEEEIFQQILALSHTINRDTWLQVILPPHSVNRCTWHSPAQFHFYSPMFDNLCGGGHGQVSSELVL
jgi:hypothetical protein